MPYCFIGFLFVFLDFSLTLPHGGALNLLPDFLGYALVAWGVSRLRHKNAHLRRASIAACAVFVLPLLEFVLNIAKVTMTKPLELALSISLTAAALYVSYEVTEGAKALERTLYKKLETDKLSAAWMILCITSLLEYLTLYLPDVALPCYIVHWIAVIWFESALFHFERALPKAK